MDGGKPSASSRRIEAYKRAAGKKRRNTFGLLVGLIFVGIGLFIINDIIVYGGILVIGISILNLYASIYAEKQLRIIGKEAGAPPEGPSPKAESPEETKKCEYCGKTIPMSDKFCGECGKKLA